MDLKYYNSYAEVDLDVLRDNFAKVKAHIGPSQGFIPVVKIPVVPFSAIGT